MLGEAFIPFLALGIILLLYVMSNVNQTVLHKYLFLSPVLLALLIRPSSLLSVFVLLSKYVLLQ